MAITHWAISIFHPEFHEGKRCIHLYSFIQSVLHLFNKCWLSTYYVLCTILTTGKIVINKTDKKSLPLYFLVFPCHNSRANSCNSADDMCSLTHLLIQQIHAEHGARNREYTTDQSKLHLYSHRASITLKETNFKLIIYKQKFKTEISAFQRIIYSIPCFWSIRSLFIRAGSAKYEPPLFL